MSPHEQSATQTNESGPERIHTRDEVVALLAERCEDAVILKERSDADGVYLMEVRSETIPATQGEYTLYLYQRKGRFPNGNSGHATVLEALHIVDDEVRSGEIVAEYDPAADHWVTK